MANEPRTLCDIFSGAASSGKPDLLISKVGGEWKPIAAADFGFTVRCLSLGLNALGIQPGDRVAILSENRPEWAMADFAILCSGALSVPIYPTLPANQIAPLLNDCGAKAVVCSTLEQLGKILTIRPQCGKLDHVILVEGNPPAEPGYTTFHALVDRGRPTLEMSPNVFQQRAARVKPEDGATIIYTSGTTGEPKGAILTHGNFVSNVVCGCEVIPLTGEGIALSFLPLSHVFERMLDYSYFYRRTSIAYAESIEKLSANFIEVKPVCFAAVPRVYEKVHAKILASVESGPGWKKKLFAWAVEVGKQRVVYMERGKALPGSLARKAKIADALVFKKIRARLGGRFVFAVSGGAPLSRALAEFFIGAGVWIYEGYGLTETSPVICVNGPGRWRLGTVGRAIRGVEVQIGEDGEILTRGPHVMKGYFNKPEATAEAIDRDGWFHTGDIGNLDADGFLAITDRKKDLIVLAGGKK
ncbi:MAG: AMP-dependent synthetase/ligase, partial [Thermoanaerobaculia bacterium]